jgi:iron complex outermembrane receptor protein
MHVNYGQAFTSGTTAVALDNSLPGIPQNQFFGNITWTQNPGQGKNKFIPGMELAADVIGRSRIYANDANTANAPGYSILNLRAQQKYKYSSLNLTTYAAIENAGNKKAVSSVIVNQSSNQFFESVLPRNYTLGVQASLPL